jgi:hypothetical protein
MLGDGVTCWNPTKFSENAKQMGKVQKFIDGYCKVLDIPDPAIAGEVNLEVYAPRQTGRTTAPVWTPSDNKFSRLAVGLLCTRADTNFAVSSSLVSTSAH